MARSPVRYRIQITEEARHQLRSLPKNLRRNIGFRLDGLATDLAGDVKKLSGRDEKYRLRIGSHRVLFTITDDLITVHAIKDRKEAYE